MPVASGPQGRGVAPGPSAAPGSAMPAPEGFAGRLGQNSQQCSAKSAGDEPAGHGAGAPGESVLITIDDHGRELTWSLRAEPAGWTLYRAHLSAHTARIRLPATASGGSQPARSAAPRRCAQHTLRAPATGATAVQHRVRCALKIGSSRTRHALVPAKDPHSRPPEALGPKPSIYYSSLASPSATRLD